MEQTQNMGTVVDFSVTDRSDIQGLSSASGLSAQLAGIDINNPVQRANPNDERPIKGSATGAYDI